MSFADDDDDAKQRALELLRSLSDTHPPSHNIARSAILSDLESNDEEDEDIEYEDANVPTADEKKVGDYKVYDKGKYWRQVDLEMWYHRQLMERLTDMYRYTWAKLKNTPDDEKNTEKFQGLEWISRQLKLMLEPPNTTEDRIYSTSQDFYNNVVTHLARIDPRKRDPAEIFREIDDLALNTERNLGVLSMYKAAAFTWVRNPMFYKEREHRRNLDF